MKTIQISDLTLRLNETQKSPVSSFREKVEIMKEMDRLCVDVIETTCRREQKADALLLHTAAPLLRHSALSCACELSTEGIDAAWDAIKAAAKPRLLLSVPTSSVQMEYLCGCKPKVLLEKIPALVAHAAALCPEVEFAAVDATRSEPEFLRQAIQAAIDAGATTVTVCDTAGVLLPDEFGNFLKKLQEAVPALQKVCLGAECSDKMHMGAACMVAAVQAGVTLLKTAIGSAELLPVSAFTDILKLRGDSLALSCALNLPVLEQACGRIRDMLSAKQSARSPFTAGVQTLDEAILLHAGDDRATVAACVSKLGYELSEEDLARVYESFRRLSEKKDIGSRELDAIVASSAMQVAPTYRLKTFVANSSNVMSATAQIELEKNGKLLQGISLGDGPIDAAFLAIEGIVGHHFDLDDFQIQAVTEGREAMGEALVKLRSNGKLYAGRGISTDIIGASIHAYISALNKICYEEAQE
ncbi:MAG: alpha-isopropylmalate synthase regulatory domain-containing protein [Firmicutes bacterium]|nr:alpha-isopropylmalate synthase regulatory domain-containing protein [Bacillota bacterium]